VESTFDRGFGESNGNPGRKVGRGVSIPSKQHAPSVYCSACFEQWWA